MLVGLGTVELELLISLRRQGYLPDGGKVAEIGAQQLNNAFLRSSAALQELASLYGKTDEYTLVKPTKSRILEGGVEHLDATAPFARPFWEWLGYEYMAVDIDGSPGSIPLDLNFDDVPADARKQYQLVTNCGTTEHVANQLQAFKVIHDLTAVGGVMIHNLPAQGMFNHGLVNYNPKFFWMLARSNHYRFLYATFMPCPDRYGLPKNVTDHFSEFDTLIEQKVQGYESSDSMLFVALQKAVDMDYVPPLDVATGTKTDNEHLRKRYPTVFDAPEPSRLKSIVKAFARTMRSAAG